MPKPATGCFGPRGPERNRTFGARPPRRHAVPDPSGSGPCLLTYSAKPTTVISAKIYRVSSASRSPCRQPRLSSLLANSAIRMVTPLAVLYPWI